MWAYFKHAFSFFSSIKLPFIINYNLTEGCWYVVYNVACWNAASRHFYYVEWGTLIKVNTGSAAQFELIRSASSFWHLFCGFEPTLFCPDPVPPSWIKTLSIYGPLNGFLAAHFGFITLSCSPLISVCISLSSFSLSLSSLSVNHQLPHFVFSLFWSVVLYVQFTYHWAFNLNRWRETNETNLASFQTISTDLPTFFLFVPVCDSFPFFFFLKWGSCESMPAVI